MSTKSICIICLALLLNFVRTRAGCNLNTKDGSVSQQHLNRLKPLEGKTFKYTYKDEEDLDKYSYTLAICSVVDGRNDYAGITQQDISTPNSFKVVGRINMTSIKAGEDWMMLTYKGGDEYGSHCFKHGEKHAKRQAHVMISCDPTQLVGKFTVLYEENKAENEQECFYMMELESSVMCSTSQIGLSTGSIIAIIFFSVVATYLLVGMVYKRCVHGSKGIDQVPNIAFWKTCGALQADGCDFLCRCQESGFSSSRPYHGIADDQLDEEADDEHLLPM